MTKNLYILYLVAIGGGVFYFEQSRALMVVLFFVGFLFYALSYIFDFKKNIRRTRFNYMNSFLIKYGDPETYLTEVEKELKNIKEKIPRNIFLINKAACLSALGRFEESLDTLYVIKPEYLTKDSKTLYYNALISNYLLSKDTFMAERILKEHPIHFIVNPNQDVNLNLIIEKNIGMYEFYTGNISKSKKVFRKLQEEKNKKGIRIFALYFLGLIYIKEGNQVEGIQKLEGCIDINRNSYIAKDAESLIKSHKNYQY